MGRRRSSVPTEAELEILQVLWSRGPSTVRQVHEVLSEGRSTACTTTLKLMQIMVEKGLLTRDQDVRPQIYRPRLSQDRTERQFVGNLMDRLFHGSARRLVLQALREKDVAHDELERVERMLDQIEQEDGK
jgi:predicted transcriptional regulator